MNKTQSLIFPLLKEFKKVCEENHIWYSLAYGSVLGAVRHHGFIPWDSDADVFLYISDKQKFRDAFLKSDHGEICLKNCETTKHCMQSHDSLVYKDKLKDVHLDIYLLVGVTSDTRKQKAFATKSYYLERIIRSKYVDIRKCKKKNRLLVLCSKIITGVIPDALLRKNISKRENMYPLASSDFVIDLGCDNKANGCIPKNVFESLIESEFEGEMFFIPENYDEYLSRTYGSDYMIPKKY